MQNPQKKCLQRRGGGGGEESFDVTLIVVIEVIQVTKNTKK